MPPRSRTTPSTSPAGRRPKVAGLRDPRRQGVSGEPTSTPGPDDAPQDTAAVTTPEAPAPGAPADVPAATAPSSPVDGTPAGEVVDTPPSVAPDDAEADERSGADGSGPRRRPTRAMTPAGASSRRGGTAVLD
ncbi:hypothetical protein ACFPBZ_22670, partial [Actinomycetospora atypica]